MTARLLGIVTVISILMISCISVIPDSSADSEITYLGTFTGGDNESSETAYYTGISCEFSRICGEGDFYVAYGAPIKMDMIQGGYTSAIYPYHDDFGMVGSIIDYPGSEHDVYNNFIEGAAKTGYCTLVWTAEMFLEGTIRCLETERSTPVLDLGPYEGEWNLSSEDAVYSGMVGHSGSFHLVDGDQIYVSYGANISLGPRDASEGFICDGENPLGISSGTAAGDETSISGTVSGYGTAPIHAITIYGEFDIAIVCKSESSTVIFDSNGGSEVPNQVTDASGLVKEPDDPVLADHVFAGWYTDGGEPFDFSQPISSDITLHAQWVDELVFTTVPTSDGIVKAVSGLAGTILCDATPSTDYTSLLWDLGDGTTSTNTYVTHYYSLPGQYTVTLTVYNEHGSDTTEFTVNVPEDSVGGGGNELLLYVAVGLLALVAGGLVVRRFL